MTSWRAGTLRGFPVVLSGALTSSLALLTDALQEPGVDLQAALAALDRSLADAVESLVTVTVTVVADGMPFSFTLSHFGDEPGTAVTSLLVPLPLLAEVEQGSELIVQAATPGAFVDLAADLAYGLGVELAMLPLDEHLEPNRAGVVSGLVEMSAINQAIGVLIERGYLPDTARSELHRLAGPDGDLARAARRLLESHPPSRG